MVAESNGFGVLDRLNGAGGDLDRAGRTVSQNALHKFHHRASPNAG
jgi:hypothetical protein